jgi:NAD(P)-dependent dehydrogenase (short-subunit alcohol dehydrogenase family)
LLLRDGRAQERQPGDPSKILIVTGGRRGIGAATSVVAAQRGYAVCVNYLERGPEAEDVVRAIESAAGRAIAVQADVGSEPDVVRLFETVDVQLIRHL